MKAKVGLVLSSLLALAACGGKSGNQQAVQAVRVRAKVVPATVVERADDHTLVGSVEAVQQAAVSSRVMAMVVAVHVKPGDRVRKGQVLVDIDPQTAQGQQAQARGALAQAQAALALAQRNYERFQALYEAKAASALELDLARMQFEQAKGAVEQAEGALLAASSVARESRVVAPFDGLVVAKLVEAGDLAAPGRPLVIVQSAKGRRLVATVPESLLAASPLRLGQKLELQLHLYPNRRLAGEVVEVAPSADPLTHTFTVKVAIEGEEVPAGTTGRLRLPLPPRRAIMVPQAAVHWVGGLTMVVVRDAEGRARSHVVTLGRQAGELVEVLSGLSGGEAVLVGLSAPPLDGAVVEEV